MRLSDTTYEKIKNTIANLYEKYNIRTLPINPFELCSKMKIKLVKYSEVMEKEREILYAVSQDGFKIEDEQGYVIFYNDAKGSSKIKFTILHEIGHIVLGHKEGSILAETEAEWFAAYAIAPPPVIGLYDISDYFDIMNIFGVTSDCAWYAMRRYKNWKKYGQKKAIYDVKLRNLFSNNT